jgi:PIN domain nuclease of toxin-antitoxin system
VAESRQDEVRHVLLDSHAFLWALDDNVRLGDRVRQALQDPNTTIWLSSATVWELGIKTALGRLELPAPLRELVRRAVTDGGLHVLDVTPEHALRAAELALHHRDPFDRMLIAQTLTERMTLASVDGKFGAYGVPTLW